MIAILSDLWMALFFSVNYFFIKISIASAYFYSTNFLINPRISSFIHLEG